MISVIIGVSNVILENESELDCSIRVMNPVPNYDKDFYCGDGGEAIVFWSHTDCSSGVIEAHFSTENFERVISSYKKWFERENIKFSYFFTLLNGELVHHEINPENLI